MACLGASSYNIKRHFLCEASQGILQFFLSNKVVVKIAIPLPDKYLSTFRQNTLLTDERYTWILATILLVLPLYLTTNASYQNR